MLTTSVHEDVPDSKPPFWTILIGEEEAVGEGLGEAVGEKLGEEVGIAVGITVGEGVGVCKVTWVPYT